MPRANATAKASGSVIRVAVSKAPVRLITRPEGRQSRLRALQARAEPDLVQIGHPSMVHLLRDPALMPDVTMAAALVERREYPLHLRRATRRSREPGLAVLACGDKGRRVSRADVRQPCASRLEPLDDFKGHVPLIRKVVRGLGPPGGKRLLIPAGNSPLLRAGGILGPAA